VQEDAEGAAAVLNVLGLVRSRLGDQPGSLKIAEEAVALMETQSLGPGLVAALAQLAAAQVVNVENPKAIVSSDRALALAAELALPVPARALAYRGAARCLMGDRGGLAELEQACDLMIEAGAGALAATSMHNLAVAIRTFNGPSAGALKMAEVRAFGLERGITGNATSSAGTEAAWLMESGRLDESLAIADELVPTFEERGQTRMLLRMREIQARVHGAMGDHVAAAEAAAAAGSAARELGDTRSLMMAPLALEAGAAEGDETRGLLAQLAADLTLHEDHEFVDRLPGLTRCALALGERELARQLAEGVEPIAPPDVHSLASVGAQLAEARGEHANAADLFADAAEGLRDCGALFEEAYALLGHGRCLSALGDPAADQPLRQARRLFDQMGARARVADCDRLIDQAVELSS
jgi:tetratricopeptide (TPR) repeat protein